MRLVILPLCSAALLVTPVFCHAGDVANNKITVSNAVNAAFDNPSAIPITLEKAWLLAETASLKLRQAEAQRTTLAGEAADAGGYLWNNPKLSGERVRRDIPLPDMASENRREWSVGIEQTFEIAGQQGYRRKASQQQLLALDATIEETRQEVRAEIERQFVQVLSLQERIETERQSLQIVEDTAAAVKKRVAAGEDSRLDGNLATVEAVRARNQIGILSEQLMLARADLALTLQLPPDQLPVVIGTLSIAVPAYRLESLQAGIAARPLLRSLELQEQAAQNRLALERAARYPDLTVGVTAGREGAMAARERLTGINVSFSLPLFRQNAGAIGRVATELSQVQIERQVALRNASANVASLWAKLQSLHLRVDALAQNVLPVLEENQRLSVKSLQAGEIGLSQLLLVSRQVLDGRRDLIDAQTELRLTHIALHQAAGWTETTSAH